MAGILSQREIDALLAALPVEETRVTEAGRSSKPIKLYDFRHPDKFSKDQLRTLELLHDQVARHAQSSLSAHLRTVVQVNLVSIDQSIYDEFVQQVPNPAVLYKLTMEPLPGWAVLELHPNIAFVIIDRLLGGYGKAMNRSRELTDVEIALLDSVTWEILAALKDAWANVTALSPKTGEIAFTPQFLQVALAADICLNISFELKISDSTGIMRLCIPYVVLEPIVGQLTAQAYYASSRKSLQPEKERQLRRNVETLSIPLVAVLGTTKVSIEELISLNVGDLIPLDVPLKGEVTITLKGRPKFLGRPGVAGRKLAIKITQVAQDTEDEDDDSEIY